jgi:SAM-dependent methyltransferase
MPRYQQTDWYDLPLYYDIVYAADTPLEANFIEAALAHYGDKATARVLEPACGTGRLMVALGQRGHAVTGFDLSQPMLDFARAQLTQHGLTGHLSQQRLESFTYRQRFDLAHCMVSSFKYLLRERDAKAHLQRIAASLKPGGIYLLGFHLTDPDQTTRQRERWVGRRDGIEVVNNLQAWPPDTSNRREAMRSRLIVQGADWTERFETHWAFRTYDAMQVRHLLKKVPELRHIATHDFDYAIDKSAELADDRLDKILVLQKQSQ